MNVKAIRRENMRALAKKIGGITPMANRLGKSQSQISHLIGMAPIKNIGDKIAGEVEKTFDKPPGWLDRLHFGAQENRALYTAKQKDIEVFYPIVPLIDWQRASNWLDITENYDPEREDPLIPAARPVGLSAFALKVIGENMEAPQGASFPDGSIIIIDPEVEAKHGSFVVCNNGSNELPLFKQLIVDGPMRYLKPLNPRYRIVDVVEPFKIIGVVREVIRQFD